MLFPFTEIIFIAYTTFVSAIIYHNLHNEVIFNVWNSRLDRLPQALRQHRDNAQNGSDNDPDSGGFYTDDNCALAHRRLSVIDPAGGSQPMSRPYVGDRFTIVYNGELYNTAELRSELGSMGVEFTTASDTEVLLNAYITWGESCLDKLNGIYAFAIWQEREKQLFLARDRITV